LGGILAKCHLGKINVGMEQGKGGKLKGKGRKRKDNTNIEVTKW
jgi:hypothetical protein